MSVLSEKLHNLITKMRAGEHTAHIDVEELVHELTTHVTETIVPALKAHLDEIMPDLAKNAIAHGLEAEREEAKKIASRLEAAYANLVKDHGQEVAQAVAQAATMVGVQQPVETVEPQPETAVNEATEPSEHTAA